MIKISIAKKSNEKGKNKSNRSQIGVLHQKEQQRAIARVKIL